MLSSLSRKATDPDWKKGYEQALELLLQAKQAHENNAQLNPLAGELASAIGGKVGGAKAFAVFILTYGLLCGKSAPEKLDESLRGLIPKAASHPSRKAFLDGVTSESAEHFAAVFSACFDGQKDYIKAMIEGISETMRLHRELAQNLFSPTLYEAFADPHPTDPELGPRRAYQRSEVAKSWNKLVARLKS